MRLAVSFGFIVTMMIGGGCLALWQMTRLQQQVDRIDTLDSAVYGIVSADNSMVRFSEELRDALTTRNAELFAAAANKIEHRAENSIAMANHVIRDSPGFISQHTSLISTFTYWQYLLPDYLERTKRLAAMGDWPAIDRRLKSQLTQMALMFDDFATELDRDLESERQRTLVEIRRRQRAAAIAVLVSSFIGIFISLFLSIRVTQGIAGPLGDSKSVRNDWQQAIFHRTSR